MRTNRLLIVCAMCVLGLLTPTAVRADGIDSFTWSWPYVGATVTWQLPASPNIPPGDVDTGDGVFSIQAPFTLNGAPARSATFDFLDSGYWGGGDSWRGIRTEALLCGPPMARYCIAVRWLRPRLCQVHTTYGFMIPAGRVQP